MTTLRFLHGLPSKRGRIPSVTGLWESERPVVMHRSGGGTEYASIDLPPDLFRQVRSTGGSHILMPISGSPPSDRVISRFLAKVALEEVAARLIEGSVDIDHLVEAPLFDPIRRYAREGHPDIWPHHSRRIHDEDHTVIGEDGQAKRTLFAYDILFTDQDEWYLVLMILGLEYSINIGEPDIDGYSRWLADHNGASPLDEYGGASESGS